MYTGYLFETKQKRLIPTADGERIFLDERTLVFCTAVNVTYNARGTQLTELTLFEPQSGVIFVSSPRHLKVVTRNKKVTSQLD